LLILQFTHEVCSEPDPDAGIPGQCHGILPGLQHFPVLGRSHFGKADFLTAAFHGFVGHQGGDQINVVVSHELRGFSVQQVAVFDAADPVKY
jgi:hypothetical protein